MRLVASGDGPFAKMEQHYRSIPRNLAARPVVTDRNGKCFFGPYQEFLVFKDERSVALTLTAPADGEASLEICIGETTGAVQLREMELRPGCAEVMWRAFENGVVLLNGSASSPVEFPMQSLSPARRYRRLQGKQDSVHNDGQPVGPHVALGPLDGLFLLHEKDRE